MMKGQQIKSRQVLRPWLEGILNKAELPGAQWIDKRIKKFMIPWPKGSNKREIEGDSDKRKIYESYAIHTGKYRPGIDQEEYNTWKSRLRCALNKAKDIEHIKEESKPDDLNPFQVYRFKDNRSENEMSEHDADVKETSHCMKQDEFMADLDEMNSYLPLDLVSIDTTNLITPIENFDENSEMMKYISEKMDSIQLGDLNNSGFEMHLKVDYLDALHFKEKLHDTYHGFFVGSAPPEFDLPLKFQEVIIKELDEEFGPGIFLFHEGNDIYCFSLIEATLLCTDTSMKPIEITSFDKKLLFTHQNCPDEKFREVVINRLRGSFSITVGTGKVSDDNGCSKHNLIEELEFRECDSVNMKSIVTFENLNLSEQFQYNYDDFQSVMQTSLNDQ